MPLPFIPETITVHLGRPEEEAENITLPFIDYLANCASSEIYPTWPENAIRANLYAQCSFALNRIYTEFYPSRGYNFDITNSTAFDQSFIKGRDIFDNIRTLASELFNNYIQRQGQVEPLFAAYCDGVEVTCNGLSQWGSVTLANEGRTPYEILTYYYGSDINLVTDVPVRGSTPSYPGVLLRTGSTGDDVRLIQVRLNRISGNYPAIPKIYRTDGFFTTDTEEAVRSFQRIFGLTEDGIIGKATWYQILRIYNAVKRLNEVDSEGIRLEEVSKEFPENLAPGSEGLGVENLQYFLSFLSVYFESIPSVTVDGVFGPQTEKAVRDAETTFGFPQSGIVTAGLWDTIYRNYLGIVETIPLRYIEGNTVPFPGETLRIGSEGDDVRLAQEYLNYIALYDESIPSVSVTGYFGEQTARSVTAFQNRYSIPASGAIGAVTWDAITEVYRDLFLGNRLSAGQYPGNPLG